MTSTNQRKFKGVVVSDKMDKTITVRVDRVRTHKKYGKRYTVSNRYKVHDEKNQYKENDIVVVQHYVGETAESMLRHYTPPYLKPHSTNATYTPIPVDDASVRIVSPVIRLIRTF